MIGGDVGGALPMFSWGKRAHVSFRSVLQREVRCFPLGAAISLQQNASEPHKLRYFINRVFFFFFLSKSCRKKKQAETKTSPFSFLQS